MKLVQQSARILIAVSVLCLITLATAQAKKPDNPGGGGGGGGDNEPPPGYEIVQLGDYISAPTGISPASAEDEIVWVTGTGAEFGYQAAMYSILDQSDESVVTAYLPEPRTPLDGGPAAEVYGDTFNRASNAHAVSSAGDIVGGCDFYDPLAVHREFSEHRAALWLMTENGYQLIDLGLADPAHNISSALDINNQGIVVGSSGLVDFGNEGFGSYHRAVVWDPVAGTIDLNDLLPEGSPWELEWARAINESGLICGGGLLDGVTRGFVFDLNTFSVESVPLPPGGYSQNTALDINEAGDVCGWTRVPFSSFRAFVWTGGASVDLGSLTGDGSNAYSLNDSGTAVGWSGISVDDIYFATSWNTDTAEMTALEDEIPDKPKWILRDAGDINNQGWIAAYGRKTYRGSNTWHGVILVPAQ